MNDFSMMLYIFLQYQWWDYFEPLSLGVLILAINLI